MTDIGIWEIQGNDVPGRLARVEIPLERHLEEWIHAKPELLELGLSIVGRQVHVDAGILDLLAVDPQGRWVVIEIKRGTLRREVLAQGLDYAACIAEMPAEELRGKLSHEIEIPDAPRDVRLCVAGTDEDPKLGRLIGFLEDKLTFSISVITYRVHVLAGGQRVLMRELTESDLLVAAPQHEAPNTDDLALRIRSRPFDDELKIIFDAAVKHGLYPRAFRWSIMFTPPTARNRCLVTVATVPRPSGHLRIWVEPPAFAKFYPVDENEVRAELGEQGWREFGDGDAEMFAQGLDRLFAIIDRKSVAQDAR